MLWLIIQPASTVDDAGMVGVALGAAVFAIVLLGVASRIGARWLSLIAMVSTAWLAGYTYFGGETATPFGFFYIVSAAAAVWYLSDTAALAQIAWMVGAYGLAIWCRVYPGEVTWPQLSGADADLLLVWGTALCAATMLIRLLKRRVVDVDQRLAAVVECSPDAVMGVDRDGRLTVWNAGAERLFGYTSSEAVGQPMSLIVPAEHEDEQREILGRVLAGEQIDRLIAERMRKDGSHVSVSLAVAPIRDAAGRVSGTSCVARDLTAETAAQRTIALQAQLLDEIDTAVVLSDSAGIVRYCNRASEELYGYASEELCGHNLLDLIIPAEFRATAKEIRHGAHSGRPVRREFDVRDKHGRVLPVDVRIRSVLLAGSNGCGAGQRQRLD